MHHFPQEIIITSTAMASETKLVVFSLIFWSSFRVYSSAAAIDTLNQGDRLNSSSSASLVSGNGFFTLRFFNLSAHELYLSIWYKTDLKKPCWLANRGRPLRSDSGVLLINGNGTLMIDSSRGDSIELHSGQSEAKVSAVLLDNGNFVLREADSGVILWQSFDYPTDSYLPGMKLGFNHKTGQNWVLTSWLSSSNPLPGAFTLEWVPLEHQLVVKRRGVKHWSSGALGSNGTFQNNENMASISFGEPDVEYHFSHFSNMDEDYLTFKVVMVGPHYPGWENVTSLLLGLDGIIVAEKSLGMSLSLYKECDGNSIGSGCERWARSKCRSHGERFEIKEVVYDHSVAHFIDPNMSLSFSDCLDKCWKDCNCVGTGDPVINADGHGCLFWYGHLEEVENGKQGMVYHMIIRPPVKKTWVWILLSIAAILIVVLLALLVFLRWRRLKLQEKFLADLMTLDNPSDAYELENDGNKGHNLKVYSISTIMDATHCFSLENKLGEGGFGPVYKGIMADGQEIAIKRLSGRSRQGLIEFKNELILIAKLQHTNLVRLLGFCIHGEEKMLVYEYMPNKSLDSYIFDQSKRALLDWNKRFEIIEGIAQGLLYLHKYSRLRIIHRDLKTGNILLDQNLNPKISDFGMARIFTGRSEANTNRIVGTFGYMSPEYAMEGIFSEKSDVFSFGVLMLEIVSGRRNNSLFHADQPLNLVGYAWELWLEGDGLNLLDPTLNGVCSREQVLRCINVALLCVEDNQLDRPLMSDVVSMLTSDGMKLSAPKQPTFRLRRRLAETSDPREGAIEDCSVNTLTISVMDGR